MQILFPIALFYPNQDGGPSNTLYWHCKELVRNGYSPLIVTSDIGVNCYKSNIWYDTDFGRVIYTNNFSYLLPLRLIWVSFTSIKKSDVIHLSSVFYPTSLIIVLLNVLFFQKKLIWSTRGEFSESALGFSSIIKKIYLKFVNIVKFKVIWHGTSDNEVADIKNLLGEKVEVVQIPNFIEISPKSIKSRKEFKYLLFIGRLHPIKGIDLLLEALLLSKYFVQSNFKLIIAGTDNKGYGNKIKKDLQTLNITEKVVLLGHVEGQEKEQLYADAHFTILPSHSENFGNVVVESMAQETPVIASLGTPWSILNQFRAGFWVSNSPDVLANTIDKCIKMDPLTYKNYSCNAFELVTKKFDIKKNFHVWNDLYYRIDK